MRKPKIKFKDGRRWLLDGKISCNEKRKMSFMPKVKNMK
jgi:hypothetical protein